MHDEVHSFLIALDPGTEKYGLAVLSRDGLIIYKTVVKADEFPVVIADRYNEYKPDFFAVGGSTRSRNAIDILRTAFDREVVVVDETNTTLEGRELAWAENPPSGIISMLPKIFWPSPPEIDAWAAVVIGRRALVELDKRL